MALLIPVNAVIKAGTDLSGFISVVKCCMILSPSCTCIAISVMPFAAAWPPVVSISTIAYKVG